MFNQYLSFIQLLKIFFQFCDLNFYQVEITVFFNCVTFCERPEEERGKNIKPEKNQHNFCGFRRTTVGVQWHIF